MRPEERTPEECFAGFDCHRSRGGGCAFSHGEVSDEGTLTRCGDVPAATFDLAGFDLRTFCEAPFERFAVDRKDGRTRGQADYAGEYKSIGMLGASVLSGDGRIESRAGPTDGEVAEAIVVQGSLELVPTDGEAHHCIL